MKRFLTIAIAALAVLAGFSCTPEAQPEAKKDTLKIVRSESTIMPDGGSCQVEVEAAQSFTVTSDKAWCAVSVSGNVITATAQPNLTNESRYCLLTIQSGSESLPFSIMQYGGVLSGLDDLSDITAPAEGREISLDVLSNMAVNLSADQPWIHASYENGKLVITVDPNDEPRTRTGQLSYSAGSVSGTLDVMQYPGLRRADEWVFTEGTPKYVYPEFQFPISMTAGTEDMYLLFMVPESAVEGDVKDYIFDVVAVEARNEILQQLEEHPETQFKDYLIKGSDPIDFSASTPGKNYLIAVGFGDNSYVSGLYQYKLITIDDIRPTYYKWTGKWRLTGKNIQGADYTEVFEISVDEEDKNADGTLKERYLCISGLCSANAAAAGVTLDMGVDVFYLPYDAASGIVTFQGQNCEKTFTHSSRGAGCYLQLMSMYIKAGATSYTNVTGGKFMTLAMNADGNTTTLVPLERTAGLLYKAFRMRLLNAAGSAYTIGGDAATIAIDDNLTVTRVE